MPAKTSASSIPITTSVLTAGAVAPWIGRVAEQSVEGQLGLPLIMKGERVTEAIYERANRMGRLFELMGATRLEGIEHGH